MPQGDWLYLGHYAGCIDSGVENSGSEWEEYEEDENLRLALLISFR